MISVLFPGQGSQSIGMGKQLFDNFDYLRPLCLKQFDISYTRFFGFATFQAIHAYIIWNW